MNSGILYGIGVGPGDPDLVTVKSARLLAECQHVFVPKAKNTSDSLALAIAGRYLHKDVEIHKLIFPMSKSQSELDQHWAESAVAVSKVLENGQDACFLTLGDPLLYSTYIYLVRQLRTLLPAVQVVTVPGIMAVNAAAALAGVPLGEGKGTVTIVPSGESKAVRKALAGGGTVALMKIGKNLETILEILKDTGTLDKAILISRAGLENQRVVTDLNSLPDMNKPEIGYLSLILVPEYNWGKIED